MCRGTIVTSSHTVGRRGALQNAGVCEQCPEVGHELPAGGELLGVDLNIACRREEEDELRPEVSQHLPPLSLRNHASELSPEPTPQLQDCAAAAAQQEPFHQHPTPPAQSVTPGEAILSLHDHGVEDALGVVAMAGQHVRNKSYQVGAVVRQRLGDTVVAGLGNWVPIHGDARPDVPYENLMDVCGQGARP